MSELVPRWLLRKIVYSGGFRLNAAERYTEEKKSIICNGPVHIRGSHWSKDTKGPYISDRHRITMLDTAMDFENWEYRFWAVEVRRDMPIMASCRLCQEMKFTAEARKSHIRNKQCTTKIIRVYQLLLRDKKCVICNKYTHFDKWGVPLCEKGLCMDMWMHDEATPPELENAILEADRQGIIGDAT